MWGPAQICLLNPFLCGMRWQSQTVSTALASIKWRWKIQRFNTNRNRSSSASLLAIEEKHQPDVLKILIQIMIIGLSGFTFIFFSRNKEEGKGRQQSALKYQNWLTKSLGQMSPCGQRCSACSVCDYHSPSHALTHTSPAYLHHPRSSLHGSACSVLSPVPTSSFLSKRTNWALLSHHLSYLCLIHLRLTQFEFFWPCHPPPARPTLLYVYYFTVRY